LTAVKNRRAFGLVLLVAAAALAAGPSLRLEAASPCAPGPMACCSSGTDGDQAAPPCGCTLKPVTPLAAVVEQAAPPVVLAEAPAAEAAAPDVPSASAEAVFEPRARAGPLFLLFSSLLN
jgi:hypothetical protein